MSSLQLEDSDYSFPSSSHARFFKDLKTLVSQTLKVDVRRARKILFHF